MAEPLAYNTNLRADIQTHTGENPKARVHSSEWVKILNGDPVEINPSVGYGYKVLQEFFIPVLKAALHSSRFFLLLLFSPAALELDAQQKELPRRDRCAAAAVLSGLRCAPTFSRYSFPVNAAFTL